MKIAVLGGSFDPIHEGHLSMAKEVLKRKLADQIWLMPAQQNPLKERKIEEFSVRCRMIQRAIAPYRKMKLCTLEQVLPVPSYTITTVRELKKRFPEHDFLWIIGEDQAKQLDLWKDIDELKQMIRFIAFERGGFCDDRQDLIWVHGFDHPASSTKVRQGQFEYLPKSVLRIVIDEGLYFDQVLKHHVSQFRYDHSLAVAETAVHLAKIHHVNETKAYVAAMMHDVCKEMDKETMRHWMNVCFPERLTMPEPVWHGWLGYEKLKRMGIYDKEILSAVYHHVLLGSQKKLDQIIYVADKSNRLRRHDVTDEIKTAERDLSQAIDLIQKNYQKRKAACSE